MGDKISHEIVGVVENGKYDSLTEAPWAAVFFPLEQNPDSDTSLLVRSPLPPAEILPELRRTLGQIDPSLPFVFHSWPDALAFVQFPARIATATLGVMGLLAAMLMRVPTSFTILGYPGLAMLFFLGAVGGGVVLLLQIVLTDIRQIRRKDAEERMQARAGRNGGS